MLPTWKKKDGNESLLLSLPHVLRYSAGFCSDQKWWHQTGKPFSKTTIKEEKIESGSRRVGRQEIREGAGRGGPRDDNPPPPARSTCGMYHLIRRELLLKPYCLVLL